MILKDKNAIYEALKAGRRVDVVRFMLPPDRDQRLSEIAEEARRRKVKVMVNARFKEASGKGGPITNVEAEVEEFKYVELKQLLDGAKAAGKAAQVVALDHIQDPRNLGAVLRSAAAAGAAGVIIQQKRCCPVTAVVYETSCGGAEHVPVAMVTNLANTLRIFKDEGFWVFGADERAEKNVAEEDLKIPLVWVLGTEGRGLHRLVRENCDFLVKIPTSRDFTSLNVSVAAGILLFEGVRQKSAL